MNVEKLNSLIWKLSGGHSGGRAVLDQQGEEEHRGEGDVEEGGQRAQVVHQRGAGHQGEVA